MGRPRRHRRRPAGPRGDLALRDRDPGWTRWDLRAGVALPRDLGLELGIDNLLDESYATHLDARNPFTGARILEPGRSFFGRLSWRL